MFFNHFHCVLVLLEPPTQLFLGSDHLFEALIFKHFIIIIIIIIIIIYYLLLLATRGTRNPNLQVVITHDSHVQCTVCSQHSFGLPLRMNGMYTQFDRARFDLLSLVI